MDEETNDLIVPLEEKEVIQDRATSQWFGNSDWFDGLEEGAEVDQSNINQILKDKKKEKKTKKETGGKSEELGDEEQMEVEVNDQVENQGLTKKLLKKINFFCYVMVFQQWLTNVRWNPIAQTMKLNQMIRKMKDKELPFEKWKNELEVSQKEERKNFPSAK